MNQPNIQLYKQIADLTGLMLKQAQNGSWDDLLKTGVQYQELVGQLKALATNYDQAELQQQLLSKILDNEKEVRQLISPELEKLSDLIDNGKTRRTAIKAYYDIAKPDVG